MKAVLFTILSVFLLSCGTNPGDGRNRFSVGTPTDPVNLNNDSTTTLPTCYVVKPSETIHSGDLFYVDFYILHAQAPVTLDGFIVNSPSRSFRVTFSFTNASTQAETHTRVVTGRDASDEFSCTLSVLVQP